MDLQKLSIGQMAELNHVSEQTLRLYDKEGLLVPRCVDPVTGYRYYHIIQSAKLDLIQNMKIYGMTLRQIRSFLDSNDPSALRALLTEQADSIEERIRQLRPRRAPSLVRSITTAAMRQCRETVKFSSNIFLSAAFSAITAT